MLAAIITLGSLNVVLAVAVIGTARLLLTEMAAREAAVGVERDGWVAERRELLNRIQRPEYVPNSPVVRFEVPDLEPDEVEKVGTIEFLGPETEFA